MSNNSKFIRQRFGPKMIGCFQGIIVIIVIVKHHPLISFFAGYWSIIRWRSYCYLFGYSLMISKGVPWISNVLCALDVFGLMAADVERSFIFCYCLTSKDKFLAKFTLDDNLIFNTQHIFKNLKTLSLDFQSKFIYTMTKRRIEVFCKFLKLYKFTTDMLLQQIFA